MTSRHRIPMIPTDQNKNTETRRGITRHTQHHHAYANIYRLAGGSGSVDRSSIGKKKEKKSGTVRRGQLCDGRQCGTDRHHVARCSLVSFFVFVWFVREQQGRLLFFGLYVKGSPKHVAAHSLAREDKGPLCCFVLR